MRRLKAAKTMSAHRFDRNKLCFDEVILIDEEVKKETENERVISKLKPKDKAE